MKQEFQYSETHCGAAPCRPDIHGVLIKGKRGRLLSVLYTAAEEHSDTLRLESAAAGLAAKPVLCISASLDVYTPPELNGGPLQRAVEAQGGTAFQHVVWPTDHFLSDYRLTLAETVLRFLQK